MTDIRDMLTEDSAKDKWCPLVRVLEFEDQTAGTEDTPDWVAASVNRTAGDVIKNKCLASECMFWRWSHQVHNDQPTGFCGAAGLPKYL